MSHESLLNDGQASFGTWTLLSDKLHVPGTPLGLYPCIASTKPVSRSQPTGNNNLHPNGILLA